MPVFCSSTRQNRLSVSQFFLPFTNPSDDPMDMLTLCARSLRLYAHSSVGPFLRQSFHLRLRPFLHTFVRPSVLRSVLLVFVRLTNRSSLSKFLLKSKSHPLFRSPSINFTRPVVRLFIYVRPSVCPFVHSYVYPSVRPSVPLSIHSSHLPSVGPSGWHLTVPSVRTSVHQSVRCPTVRPLFRPSVRSFKGPPILPSGPVDHCHRDFAGAVPACSLLWVAFA